MKLTVSLSVHCFCDINDNDISIHLAAHFVITQLKCLM